MRFRSFLSKFLFRTRGVGKRVAGLLRRFDLGYHEEARTNAVCLLPPRLVT